jgi:hypothetical protein
MTRPGPRDRLDLRGQGATGSYYTPTASPRPRTGGGSGRAAASLLDGRTPGNNGGTGRGAASMWVRASIVRRERHAGGWPRVRPGMGSRSYGSRSPPIPSGARARRPTHRSRPTTTPATRSGTRSWPTDCPRSRGSSPTGSASFPGSGPRRREIRTLTPSRAARSFGRRSRRAGSAACPLATLAGTQSEGAAGPRCPMTLGRDRSSLALSSRGSGPRPSGSRLLARGPG